MLAFALASAQAQNIYGTYEDWTNWNGDGDGCIAVTTFSFGDITQNGIGNNTGGTSVTGSLQLDPMTAAGQYSWNIPVYGPGLNNAVMAAMDGAGFVPVSYPPPDYSQVAGTVVAQSGSLLMDFVMPDNNTPSTFLPGLWFQDNNTWTVWFASSLIDLGSVTTPNGQQEEYQAIIPYSLSATSYTYANIGIANSQANSSVNDWYVTSISVVPLVIPPTQTPLFTTYDDFNQWTSGGGDLVQGDNTWSVSTDDTNGIGNITAAADIGTAGSLAVYWNPNENAGSDYGACAYSPNEAGNTAFMQAIDPGSTANATVAAYGNIYWYYSQPDGGGNYFGLAFMPAYDADGYWQQFYSSSTVDTGTKDNNGDEVYMATIPYTITAGSLTGFYFDPFINSGGYNPQNPFHIDDITVAASQAPQITSTSLNGTTLTLSGIGGLSGYAYKVVGTSNLLNPQWTTVTSGNEFTGPTWTTTVTINPANQATYYAIQTVAP